jgi:hypothetical protein
MIREFIAQLRNKAKGIAEAFIAKLGSALRTATSPLRAQAGFASVIAASEGNVLDTGKRYRLTSGHAPLFSLFTFFANR